MLIARRFITPRRHAGARHVGEFLTEKSVQPLDRREGLALKIVELDIEEAMIVAGSAEGDHAPHPQFTGLHVDLAQPWLVDVIAEGFVKFEVKIGSPRE